jgi:hypothetical protein
MSGMFLIVSCQCNEPRWDVRRKGSDVLQIVRNTRGVLHVAKLGEEREVGRREVLTEAVMETCIFRCMTSGSRLKVERRFGEHVASICRVEE